MSNPNQEPIISTRTLIAAEGQLLLACRATGQELGGMWELPGGKADPHEDTSLHHAAFREVFEETGLEVIFSGHDPVLLASYVIADGKHAGRPYSAHGFVGTVQGRKTDILKSAEHGQLLWFDTGRLLIEREVAMTPVAIKAVTKLRPLLADL